MANQDNLDFIEWAIDDAKAWGAETCLILGDWHDSRHSVHVGTLDYSLRGMEMVNNAFDRTIFLVGNHDLLYRNKRDVSSTAMARHLPNITFVDKPITLGEGKDAATFLPWLVGDETKMVKKLKSRYIFGHLELNGGFLMNAKVEMPDHPGALHADDFTENEYVFSGHFHFRQAKGRVIYIGNPFPFNFADAWDDDRGMMLLEWGKEPEFRAWPDQPLFRTFKLSQLLTEPDKLLRSKLTARCTLDIDISYEEAQIIKETYVSDYGLRKIELVHQPRDLGSQDFETDAIFQSVDQIVIEGLNSVQSNGLDSKTLIEIYRSLNEV